MASQLGKNQYKSGGMTDTLHGCSYQLKLLMLFMHQGTKQNYRFSLASEMEEAEKLDDLVFSYEEGGKTIHRLVQAKHKKDTKKTISKSEMLADDGDFSLLRYFTSLRQITPKEQFQGEIKDIIICTNIDLEKQVKYAFFPIEDNIFNFKDVKPEAMLMKLKAKSKFADDLRKVLKYKHANIIAQELVKAKNQTNFPKNNVFILYEGWLLENVLEQVSKNGVNFVKVRNEFPIHSEYVKEIFNSMRLELGEGEVKWCLGKIKLKKTHQPLELGVEDEEIDDYFEKYVIAVNQPGEKELSDILKDQITEERARGTDAALIVSQLLQHVLNWNNEERLCFQRTEDVKKVLLNIQQMLACHASKGTTEAFRQKYKKPYNFKPTNKVIEEIESFLKQDKVNVLNVVFTKSCVLSIMKILQVIGDNIGDDILCDSNALIQLANGPACLVNAFQYELCRLMVVDMNSESILATEKSILGSLIDAATSANKKLILVTPSQFQSDIDFLFNNKLPVKVEDFQNNMQDFKEESKTNLLNNAVVQFQDRKVALRSLVNDNANYIKDEILSKLVSKQDVKIGKSLSDKNYEETKDYFIERSLIHSVEIEQSIYDEDDLFLIVTDPNNFSEVDEHKDVILISDSDRDFENLGNRLNNNIHWLRSIYSWKKTHNSTNKISTGDFKTCDVILIIEDDDSDDDIFQILGEKYPEKNIVSSLPGSTNLTTVFEYCEPDSIVNLICSEEETYNDLCELYPNQVIHWYSWEEKLIWYRTRGRLDRLWKYINKEENNNYCESVTATQISDRVIVVSAEPGMGKTTLLTHVALNINSSSDFSQLWVVKVNLINYFDVFKKLMFANVGLKEGIQFLLRSLKLGSIKDENGSVILLRDLVVIEDDVLTIADTDLVFDENDLLDVNVFIDSYNSGKVVVTLDGYDEACPDYKQVVLDLILMLNQSKIRMMWISTRPYNIVDELQIKCSVLKYTLAPFENHLDFFNKFWSKRMRNVTEEHCKIFVDKLFETLSKHINRTSLSSVTSFVSVPLHLKMLATVYENSFQSYCLRDVSNLDEDVFKNFSLFQLYNKFLTSKFVILGVHNDSDEETIEDDTRHTNDDSLTKIKAIKNAKKSVRETALENHKLLALLGLYEEDKLRLYLSESSLESLRRLTKIVKESEEETGIIDGVTPNGQPHFIHRTFAEYFAAIQIFDLLMVQDENFRNVKDFFYTILTEKDSQSSVLFTFFNYKCVEDSNALISVLNGAEILIERDNRIYSIEQNITDLYRRTGFHLTASDIDWREFPAAFSVEHPAQMLKDSLFEWTPLHYAVAHHRCRDNGVREKGIPWPNKVPYAQAVNVQDYRGVTPVMLSLMRRCNPSCILLYYMMKSNPHFNLIDNRTGRTGLHLLLDNYKDIEQFSIIEFIDRCGSYDALIEDNNGDSALSLAIGNEFEDIVIKFQNDPQKYAKFTTE